MTLRDKLELAAHGKIDNIAVVGCQGDCAYVMANVINILRDMGHKVEYKTHTNTKYNYYISGRAIAPTDFQWTFNGILINGRYHYWLTSNRDHGDVYLFRVKEIK